MHEGNYQLLYLKFLDFAAVRNRPYCSTILEIALSHTFEFYIDQEHILLEEITESSLILLLLR